MRKNRNYTFKEQLKWKTNTKFQVLNVTFLTAYITQKIMLVKQAQLKWVLAVVVIVQPIPAATPLRLKTSY
jgi:hypothetical protein